VVDVVVVVVAAVVVELVRPVADMGLWAQGGSRTALESSHTTPVVRVMAFDTIPRNDRRG
jgi:hypothetical protein